MLLCTPTENAMRHHDFDEEIPRRGSGCKKWDTYPEDVLPMWVADTDFKAPQEVIDAVIAKAAHGVYGYTGMTGGSFEKATASWMQRRHGWDADPSWVEYTPTIGTSLAFAVTSFTQPGDFVVMQTPIYPPFRAAIETNGRRVAANPLLPPGPGEDGAYRIDFEDLEKKLAMPRARLLLLCNPHNPTGRCFTREELQRISELCLRHNVIVFSDEIHADFIYGGQSMISFPTLSPEAARQCLVTVNPSKTFNVADFKTAAVISANADLMDRYRATMQSARLGRISLCILAYEVAYTQCDYYVDQVRDYIGRNMDYAVSYFRDKIPGIGAYRPEATYLLWLDCRKLGMGQNELEAFFIEKAKVAFNSGTDFGEEGRGFMRMNLGCTMKTMKEAMPRIERAVNALGVV